MFFVFAKQSVCLRIQVVWAGARLGRDTKRACENRRVRLARFARVIVHTHKRFACVICNSFRIKRGARWMPHNSTVVNTFLRTAAETLPLVR